MTWQQIKATEQGVNAGTVENENAVVQLSEFYTLCPFVYAFQCEGALDLHCGLTSICVKMFNKVRTGARNGKQNAWHLQMVVNLCLVGSW